MLMSPPKVLKETAARQLPRAGEPKKIVAAYAGILVAAAAISTGINLLLDSGIAHTGGLQSIGTRSMLSTISSLLPIVQLLISMCLSFGFSASMLRIARGQFASPRTLKAGLDRFGALLRTTILLDLMAVAIGIVSLNIASVLFSLSPLSRSFYEAAAPLMEEASFFTGALDIAAQDALMEAMAPFIPWIVGIFLVVFLALFLPVMYRYRMAYYFLIDNPSMGAFASVRASRQAMRGNCIALFKLDLSFWWYYILSSLAPLLLFGDIVLALLGVSLPLPALVTELIFYGLSLAAQFAVIYFFTDRVECAYAAAYDSLLPKQRPGTGGVVLGNIFQM